MSEDPEEKTMTFWEHLDELRSRVIRMIIAFLIGAILAWVFRHQILIWLTEPFINAWNQGQFGDKPSLHFPAPASLFVAYIKQSIFAGLVLALPVLFYQVWAFIAPGLYSHEKKFAIPFVAVSTLLFTTGAMFGLRVVFPLAFKFLLALAETDKAAGFDVKPTVMIGDYLEFITRGLIAFGAAFELPVLIFFLSLAGIINHRQLIRFLRYFVVLAFVLSAVLTPPDMLSQVLLACPLIFLYVISIGAAWVIDKRRERKTEPSEPTEPSGE